jgi:hypothetical protein
MDIFLTFDYELFFGSVTGSPEKCILNPTEKLLELASRHQTPMVFFIDVGYLIALEKQMDEFPILFSDHNKVVQQIKDIITAKSDVQLHIHPHWEKSYYDGEKWVMVTKGHYKLSDFSQDEVVDIVRRYKFKLDEISGRKSIAFRAGGWCIEPFDILEKVFMELGIKYDTSVFPGGHFESGEYDFDFRGVPTKNPYTFQNTTLKEAENGFFKEYAIGSHRYSPLFYWKLYILGRLNPKDHKSVGDGFAMSQPGRKKQVLTNFTWNHASTDGFYATKMKTITKIALAKKEENLIFIGHPKGCTLFAFKELDKFLSEFKNKCNFQTFHSLK